MPSLVATPGAANANAYLTTAEAADYFASRPGGEAWQTGDPAIIALIHATRLIDQRSFRGRRADVDQALAWPRLDVRMDGVTLGSDAIPRLVKEQTAEVALWLQEDGESIADLLAGFSDVKVGPISAKLSDMPGRSLPNAVIRALQPIEAGRVHQFQRLRA